MLKSILITSIAVLLFCVESFGQIQTNWSTNIGIGVNTAFADLAKNSHNYSSSLAVSYHSNSFVQFNLEAQYGKLSGGDKSDLKDPRQFTNAYKSASIGIQLYAGLLIGETNSETLDALKNLYLGIGGGAIMNQIKNNIRQKPNSPTEQFPGVDRGINLLMPIQVGFMFPIANDYGDSRFSLAVNYQTNFTFGEGLDGYNENALINKNPDLFTVFAIGLRYNFGRAVYW